MGQGKTKQIQDTSKAFFLPQIRVTTVNSQSNRPEPTYVESENEDLLSRTSSYDGDIGRVERTTPDNH